MISETLFFSAIGSFGGVVAMLIGVIWAMLNGRINSANEECNKLWKQIDKHRDTKVDRRDFEEVKSDMKAVSHNLSLMSNAMAEMSEQMSNLATNVARMQDSAK